MVRVSFLIYILSYDRYDEASVLFCSLIIPVVSLELINHRPLAILHLQAAVHSCWIRIVSYVEEKQAINLTRGATYKLESAKGLVVNY